MIVCSVMILNIDVQLEHPKIITCTFTAHKQHSQTYLKCNWSVSSISDHFWPFVIFCNVFIWFSIFACLYLTYCYINRLSVYSPHYRTYTWWFSDLVWPLPIILTFIIFAHSGFLIIFRFGCLHYYYTTWTQFMIDY